MELSRRITVTVHLATKRIDGGRLKWHGTGNVMDHLRALEPVGYRVEAHPAGDGAYDLEYVLDEWAQRNDELSLGFKIELPQSQPWNEPFLTTDLTTLDLTPWAPVRMRHTWDATTRLNPGDLLAYEYVSRQAYERKRAPRRLHFDELPDGHGVELSLSQREARFCFFGHRHRVPAPI